MNPGPTRKIALTTLAWLLAAPLALAHHLPPGMEEVDEFGNETLRSQIIHPFTGLDHWMLTLGIASWLILGFQGFARLRKRRAMEHRSCSS
jgi:hydrogenase/urease accessory protein HupE